MPPDFLVLYKKANSYFYSESLPMLSLPHLHKVLLVMLMAVVTAILFRTNGTYDINIWQQWGQSAYEHGIAGGYSINRNDNYPPLPTVILWVCYTAANFAGIAPVIFIKISLLACLLASTAIFYHWSEKSFLATSVFYCTMAFSSLGLAYLDIYMAPWLLWAFYSLQRGRVAIFSFCFTVACLVKYAPLMMGPFLALYLVMKYIRPSHIVADVFRLSLRAIIPSALPIAIALFFFGGDLVNTFRSSFSTGWLSGYGLNFNWIVTRFIFQTGIQPLPEGADPTVAALNVPLETPLLIAKILFNSFLGATVIVFLLRQKNFENLLMFVFLGCFSYFIFAAGVHENHLFLANLLVLILLCINPGNLYLAIGISLISSLNMFMFFGFSGSNACILYNPAMVSHGYSVWLDAPLLLAVFNTMYFLLLWIFTVAAGWNEIVGSLQGVSRQCDH
jgi:hypothetical protein